MTAVDTTVTVVGMTCGNCVRHVTEELEAITGVTAVAVDLDTGAARITAAGPLDRAVIAAAVDEAGYELAP